MNNQIRFKKLIQTALLAALCFVSFTYLQIKIPVPGGDATSLHIGNAFCVLAALLLGGWYGGLAGAIGMTIADLLDPVYITVAPKTFVLKLCIGLITGLIAHKYAKINESNDKKYILKVIIHVIKSFKIYFLAFSLSDFVNKIFIVNIKMIIVFIISIIEQKYGIFPLSIFISDTAHAEKINKEIAPNNNDNKINPTVSNFFLYRFLLNTPILLIIVV